MAYALEILNRHGPALGKRPTGRQRFVDAVTCAYCGGAGADPKCSNASGCPVCRGPGVVRVVPPVVVCRRCAGSGRVSGDLICLTCITGWGCYRCGMRPIPVPVAAEPAPKGSFIATPVKGKGSSEVRHGDRS
jgi:hypothetical protein